MTNPQMQEYRDELFPRYNSWADWYLDVRSKSEQKGREFENSTQIQYAYYPLQDVHDMNVIHIYSTTVGFMRAKIFESMEELMKDLKSDSVVAYHFESLRNRKFRMDSESYMDSLIKFIIDFVFAQEHFNKKAEYKSEIKPTPL